MALDLPTVGSRKFLRQSIGFARLPPNTDDACPAVYLQPAIVLGQNTWSRRRPARSHHVQIVRPVIRVKAGDGIGKQLSLEILTA